MVRGVSLDCRVSLLLCKNKMQPSKSSSPSPKFKNLRKIINQDNLIRPRQKLSYLGATTAATQTNPTISRTKTERHLTIDLCPPMSQWAPPQCAPRGIMTSLNQGTEVILKVQSEDPVATPKSLNSIWTCQR